MGWAIGFDSNHNRDIGYGVPATCDHPGCGEKIDRGLGYVCGGDVYGGENGCGLFFCGDHRGFAEGHGDPVCERCAQENEDVEPFKPTPDIAAWVSHKLTDKSWGAWRDANPETVSAMRLALSPSSCGTEPSGEVSSGDLP